MNFKNVLQQTCHSCVMLSWYPLLCWLAKLVSSGSTIHRVRQDEDVAKMQSLIVDGCRCELLQELTHNGGQLSRAAVKHWIIN